MQYFGGKQRISKELAEFFNKNLAKDQPFYDLFCGSCNVISKVDKNRKRYANDLHKELISMWKFMQQGGELPSIVTYEQYREVIKNKNNNLFEDWYKGFVGFGCSFGGRYFEGFARKKAADNSSNYAAISKISAEKKMINMKDVIFSNLDYSEVNLEDNSMLYCDIPYKTSTKKYAVGEFNHEKFYDWATEKSKEGFVVLVSEYKEILPIGWEIVWQKDSKKSMRSKIGECVETTEVLIRKI